MDRHRIWRIVRNNLESLQQFAPEAHAPVVDVYVVGRSEPVRLNQVHTSQDPEFPWTLLSEGEVEGEFLSKADRAVPVHLSGLP